MKKIINIVLALVIVALVYLLYQSISGPIVFRNQKEIRKDAVVQKLMDIRTAQEHYRAITGADFADSFQKLKDTLTHGTFLLIRLEGDVDNPLNNTVIRDTTFVAASDSIPKLGLNLDSLAYIPYGNGTKFDIAADTITYQKSLVNVVEVKTQWKNFMGKFADSKYQRYDQFYDPESYLKFGDMNKPNISGNWER